MSEELRVAPKFPTAAEYKRAMTWLLAGTLMSAVVLHFIYLQARSGTLRWLDPHVLQVWHRATPPNFDLLLMGLSRLVTVVVLWPLLGFTSWIFWRKNRIYDAIGLLCAITLPAVIALAAKMVYHVPRPRVEWNIGSHWSHAFPSGHVALVMTLGGMTAYFGWREGKSVLWTRCAIFITAVLTLLMGFGRVALGAHFLSDVIGGLALGAIWLPVSIAITKALRSVPQSAEE